MDSLSGTQKLFRAFTSRETFAAMENESRSWMMQCPNCKYEISVWDMGGIRWKAAGTPKYNRVCPNCNQKGWHTLYKKTTS
jgi:transposase-like protein